MIEIGIDRRQYEPYIKIGHGSGTREITVPYQLDKKSFLVHIKPLLENLSDDPAEYHTLETLLYSLWQFFHEKDLRQTVLELAQKAASNTFDFARGMIEIDDSAHKSAGRHTTTKTPST